MTTDLNQKNERGGKGSKPKAYQPTGKSTESVAGATKEQTTLRANEGSDAEIIRHKTLVISQSRDFYYLRKLQEIMKYSDHLCDNDYMSTEMFMVDDELLHILTRIADTHERLPQDWKATEKF